MHETSVEKVAPAFERKNQRNPGSLFGVQQGIKFLYELFVFQKWANPGLLFVYFYSFHIQMTNI